MPLRAPGPARCRLTTRHPVRRQVAELHLLERPPVRSRHDAASVRGTQQSEHALCDAEVWKTNETTLLQTSRLSVLPDSVEAAEENEGRELRLPALVAFTTSPSNRLTGNREGRRPRFFTAAAADRNLELAATAFARSRSRCSISPCETSCRISASGVSRSIHRVPLIFVDPLQSCERAGAAARASAPPPASSFSSFPRG